MKKIYNLLVVAVAMVISASSFAQGLTVDTYAGKAWPWEVWGEVKSGDTIVVEGSYTQTIEHNADTTFTIESVELVLMHLDAGWAGVDEHRVIVVNSEMGDLASGVFSKGIVVPSDFPLTSTDEAGKWLIQTRAFYTFNGERSTVGPADQFSNAWITVVEGGVVAPTDIEDGLTVSTYAGKAWPWETWGEVTQGESIRIQGTFSQSIKHNDDTTFVIDGVELVIMHLDAGWAGVDEHRIIVADANNGDLSNSIIDNVITVPMDFPLTETDEAGKWLIQTRAFYSFNGERSTVGPADQFSNAWITIVAGGTTSVNEIKLDNGINAYPNPVNSGEALRISSRVFTDIVDVKVYNLVGAEIYSGSGSIENMRISTEGFAPGMYNVLVKSNGQSAVQKVVVR